MIEKKYINVVEAATLLSVTERYIYTLVREKKLKAYKPFGKKMFFDKEELHTTINAGYKL